MEGNIKSKKSWILFFFSHFFCIFFKMSKLFEFSLLVAKTLRGGIGKNNTLPWHIKADLQGFSKRTTNNVIIMGRNTYESLPKKPLPNRIHIVISSRLKIDNPNVIVVPDFHQGLEASKHYFFNQDKKIFVVGGRCVYNDALDDPNCKRIYVTQILNDIECDTYISSIPDDDYEIDKIGPLEKQDEIYYQFLEYKRRFNMKCCEKKIK
jgi:dihydrofolate reductase